MSKVILDTENTKQKIQTHWDNNVCGFNKGKNFNEIDNWALKAHPYHPEEFRTTGLVNKEILEIGVGSATTGCHILQNSRPKSYTFYDISQKTLAIAKSHIRQHHPNFSNAHYLNGDMENMNILKNNSFDRVYAIGSIHHTPNPNLALKETARVLKPGGDFLFMFYNQNSRHFDKVASHCAKLNKSTKNQEILNMDGATNPCTILYTKNDVIQLCSKVGLVCKVIRKRAFSDVDRSIFFKKYRLKIFPSFLERFWGAYMYVYGVKHNPENS